MSLENSAEALVRYLEAVEQQGVFTSAHGEILLVKPHELHKYLDQVINDLLGINDIVRIVVTAGVPVKKTPNVVSAAVVIAGSSSI